ncbi:hypothetical protein A1O1_02353 [Capronia coronata CBS 617.96]|uniref:F-box domain-containing protein n=1 Tax=Capronia coronata CBS 617.96 TaxID=1182541 RepID=W9YWC2_9EURO|nr:uncharacterized protein A1O1_02353 [Capronia coronata CBS 617.96]EXJ93960.1 hypothetical protein A1O1_02353 [Capronia coronata CBS 617.96]
MVMVTSVLRRATAVTILENGSSSEEFSRQSFIGDGQQPRRSSLAGLSIRLSRSKRSKSAKQVDTWSDLAAQKLGEALFSLPHEIVVQILCCLPPTDILALRLTSRPIYCFLQAHATPITRSLLKRCAYEHTCPPSEDNLDVETAQYTYNYIQTLYPQPLLCNSTDYLLQMLRRQAQIDRILSVTVEYIHMKIYMLPSCPRFDDFGPYRLKLIRRLHLAAWTIYHSLEKYREMLIFEHPSHPRPKAPSEARQGTEEERIASCPSCARFVKTLLPLYPGTEVIPAYNFYQLCRQHLRLLSRAPAYAGTIERKLRGRNRKPPTDADLATFVVLGGIPEMCKLSMLKGTYSQRIEVIGSFLDKVNAGAAEGPDGCGRVDASSVPQSQRSAITASILSPASFASLTAPMTAPLQHVTHETLDAVPDLDSLVTDSNEWIRWMFQLVGPDDQILSPLGFVQNVLAGKGHGRRSCHGGEGESHDHEEDQGSQLDYLAPVKGFD